jgi:hypothetical protein
MPHACSLHAPAHVNSYIFELVPRCPDITMLVCAIVSSNMFSDERVKVVSMLGLGHPRAWATLRSRGFDRSSFEHEIRALGGLTHAHKFKNQKKIRKNAACKHENKTHNNEYKHTRTHTNMHTHTHNTHTHTRTQKHKYPMHARCVRVGVCCLLKTYVCVCKGGVWVCMSAWLCQDLFCRLL